MSQNAGKVVLACSGGLDTSVILRYAEKNGIPVPVTREKPYSWRRFGIQPERRRGYYAPQRLETEDSETHGPVAHLEGGLRCLAPIGELEWWNGETEAPPG